MSAPLRSTGWHHRQRIAEKIDLGDRNSAPLLARVSGMTNVRNESCLIGSQFLRHHELPLLVEQKSIQSHFQMACPSQTLGVASPGSSWVSVLLPLCRDVGGHLLCGKQGPGPLVFSETEKRSRSPLVWHQVSSPTDQGQAEGFTTLTPEPGAAAVLNSFH